MPKRTLWDYKDPQMQLEKQQPFYGKGFGLGFRVGFRPGSCMKLARAASLLWGAEMAVLAATATNPYLRLTAASSTGKNFDSECVPAAQYLSRKASDPSTQRFTAPTRTMKAPAPFMYVLRGPQTPSPCSYSAKVADRTWTPQKFCCSPLRLYYHKPYS